MSISPASQAISAKSPMRAWAMITILCLAGVGLAGCSNAGSTTCSEWSEKSDKERTAVAKSMLRSNDLEPSDLGNLVGIDKQINGYCGILGLPGGNETPQNPSSEIENAIDWSAKTW